MKHCSECHGYNYDGYAPAKSIIKPQLNIALLESTITMHYQPGYISIDQLTHLRTAFDYMVNILLEQKLITNENCVHLCELNNKLYFKAVKQIAEGVEKLYDRNET